MRALKPHLVVFTRQPRFGCGKRRLAKDIGETETYRFQRAMLAVTLRRLGGDPRWRTWLAVTPDRSKPWPRRYARHPQGAGDLGQRMGRVFRALPPGPIIIIGNDIPGITSEMIVAAFRILGAKDAVFGPAHDGGYWLIGLRRRPRLLMPFANVRWSSEQALADTLANLHGHSVGFVNTLADIDDGAAFKRRRSSAHG